jgi:prophage antirepressor-like protein
MSQNIVSVFNFDENTTIRTAVVNETAWFLASDVASALEYASPDKAYSFCRHPTIMADVNRINNLHPSFKWIQEPDLYRLVMKSTKPEAEKFQDWVCDDVLPSLRKTGQYGLKQTLTPAEMFAQSAQLLLEQERKINQTAQDVKQLESKVSTMQIDLRNGVPFGCIAKRNAWHVYCPSLGYDTFKQVMEHFKVDTENYVHHAEGFSTPTFAYVESQIKTVINKFIEDLTQETKCYCHSNFLNKRVKYLKSQTTN